MTFLLDFIPTWVWLILAVAALVAAWRFLGTRGFLAALGAIVTVGAYRAGRTAKGRERAADRAKERIAAQDERLEMHREADAIERAQAAKSHQQAQKEAMEWAKRR